MVGTHKGSCHLFDTSGMNSYPTNQLNDLPFQFGTVVFIPYCDSSCVLKFPVENKLHIKDQIYLQSNKNKSSNKKITGFQVFADLLDPIKRWMQEFVFILYIPLYL